MNQHFNSGVATRRIPTQAAARDTRRNGFTIVELLTVVAIVGLLAGLTLAAVQYAREAARRGQCAANLRQIGIALQSYHAAHGMFPLGNTRGFSFHTAILAQMELTGIEAELDRRGSPSSLSNLSARNARVPVYLCPSDPGAFIAAKDGSRGTNYGANFGGGYQRFGDNGFFRGADDGSRSGVSAREITDGLSSTAAVAEILIGTGEVPATGRAVFSTPAMADSSSLEAFAGVCAAITATTTSGAPDLWSRGRYWISGDRSETGYNHVLPPNHNNCTNGNSVIDGAYSAASMHGGLVELLYADGHIDLVSASIDPSVWRAIGSRSGGEAL